MSLSAIMQAGLTAMQASQTGMKVASQNIANANTAGYVRTEVSFSPLTNLGPGSGVEVSSVRRAADKFLATAAYIAQATNGAATARSDLLARAQSYFGDPTGDSSVFASFDEIWSAFSDLQVDPSSSLARDKVVTAIDTSLAAVGQTAANVQSLISEADERLGNAVEQAQSLMTRIADLNDEIRLTMRSGADPSGVENAQSALIDDLSKLMDVRVEARSDGGVFVRTSGGALLVGAKAAQISYTPSGSAFATHGVISFNADLGAQSNLEPYISGGEIAGLLKARDEDLPALAEALGGFSGALADQLNKVHNENSSTPAIGSLTGRQTGLLATDALNFTGRATIGLTDGNGVLQQRFSVDFDAVPPTITGENPAAVYTLASNTVGGLANALNAALGAATPSGSASFTNGVLSLNVGSGGGLVIQQDGANPSDRAGRGFSHFFGLNDLVSRPTPYFFEAGVSGTDAHGLNTGGGLTFQVKDASGRLAVERTVTVSGTTWNDLIAALNTSGTGIGEFATVGLDANGRLTITPKNGFQLAVTDDSTLRGGTGVSVSGLFGLNPQATAGRAYEMAVNQTVADDPTRLAVGKPDLTADIGQRIIELGDNRGAAALTGVRDASANFAAAGALGAQTTTLGLYASRLGGAAGRMASEADHTAKGAAAVAAAAVDRRSEVESVSVDEELLRMTTYQNSYAAAARVIQAASDMFDILLTLGTTTSG